MLAAQKASTRAKYKATLAEYGAYALYTVEWTTVPSLVDGYLSHRSAQRGDHGFVQVRAPSAFTVAYTDNGGLFLARPGLGVTLGGALGAGVNGRLDPAVEASIDRCLSGGTC